MILAKDPTIAEMVSLFTGSVTPTQHTGTPPFVATDYRMELRIVPEVVEEWTLIDVRGLLERIFARIDVRYTDAGELLLTHEQAALLGMTREDAPR